MKTTLLYSYAVSQVSRNRQGGAREGVSVTDRTGPRAQCSPGRKSAVSLLVPEG